MVLGELTLISLCQLEEMARVTLGLRGKELDPNAVTYGTRIYIYIYTKTELYSQAERYKNPRSQVPKLSKGDKRHSSKKQQDKAAKKKKNSSSKCNKKGKVKIRNQSSNQKCKTQNQDMSRVGLETDRCRSMNRSMNTGQRIMNHDSQSAFSPDAVPHCCAEVEGQEHLMMCHWAGGEIF